MPRTSRSRRRASASGQTPTVGRQKLVPDNPLSGWQAFIQTIFLLGIPMALLLLAKVILRMFFPELGY